MGFFPTPVGKPGGKPLRLTARVKIARALPLQAPSNGVPNFGGVLLTVEEMFRVVSAGGLGGFVSSLLCGGVEHRPRRGGWSRVHRCSVRPFS
jgi:hypothetical protein